MKTKSQNRPWRYQKASFIPTSDELGLAVLGLATVFACLPALARASIIVTDVNLTTAPNSGGGDNNGTGVWFDPLTGYAELRGSTFPNPLFQDGKYFLNMDTEFVQTEAEIYTEGLFSRGNGVIYQSSSDLNPARFGDCAVLGPSTGYQSPGAGYTDLGPTFGNWAAGGHGYIGLTIRDPNSTGTLYGYAEVNINPDFSTTLLSFAVNTVPGQSITTVSTVPEPGLLCGVGLVSALLARRARNSRII